MVCNISCSPTVETIGNRFIRKPAKQEAAATGWSTDERCIFWEVSNEPGRSHSTKNFRIFRQTDLLALLSWKVPLVVDHSHKKIQEVEFKPWPRLARQFSWMVWSCLTNPLRWVGRICFVHRPSRQRFANRRFDDSPNATGNRGALSPIDAFPLKSPATSSRFGTSFLKRRARQAVKRIARFRNARICGCLFSRQFHRQKLTVPSKQLAYHPCSSMEYSIYPYMVCFFNL